MLSPPEGLDERVLLGALESGWGLRSASASYLPVGAGSHHWRVGDVDGADWFVTVDDLDARRDDPDESRTDVFDRLSAAFRTAHVLFGGGASFVVAPIASVDGRVLRPVGERWAAAVYPLIEGETFRGGQRLPLADRLEVVDLIARLHTTPVPLSARPRADDHRLQNRRDLERAVQDPVGDPDAGPYAGPLARFLIQHRQLVLEMLAEYDGLAARAAGLTERHVLTHGEPHAGNMLRNAEGWVLIDWDTALLAAPERDLWLLEPGDGAATGAYQAATGIEVVPELLDLFRLCWDLKDLGVDVARLRAPHATSADDNRAWEGVTHVLSRRAAGDVVPRAAWR